MLQRLAAIAEDELAGLPISREDNEYLRDIGRELGFLFERTTDYGYGGEGADDQAALVADIFTNPLGDQVLEVGTGRIDEIYVLVPDDEGGFVVAKGGVYSYYEFWHPRGERLSDEEWRALLDEGDVPERPQWVRDHLGL